jgi:hypothetical protein
MTAHEQLDLREEEESFDAWFRGLPLSPFGGSVRFASSRSAVACCDKSALPPAGPLPSGGPATVSRVTARKRRVGT